MKNPYDKQIGGSHYQKFKIQPSKFVIENELLYPEGCVIKYILRHRLKGKKQDLEKAKHFIDMIIERDYTEKKDFLEEAEKEKKDTRLKHIYLTSTGEKLFDEIFFIQKKRIYKALLNSSSQEVLYFDNVIKRIINEKI